MIISIDTTQFEHLDLEEAALANAVSQLQRLGPVVPDNRLLGKFIGVHANRVRNLIDMLITKEFLENNEDELVLTDKYAALLFNELETEKVRKNKAVKKGLQKGPKEGYKMWLDMWNKAYKTKYKMTTKKMTQIRARREKFSPEEIRDALKNRHKDLWINTDGKKYLANWNSFWRNDDKIDHYLTKKQDGEIRNEGSYITGSV